MFELRKCPFRKKSWDRAMFYTAASPLLLTTHDILSVNRGDQLLDLWERNVVPFLSDIGS